MEEVLFRIIIVGDSSVGKTCILLSFTEGHFRDTHDITVGVELGNRLFHIENQQIKFQIWDTSGQENYRSITRSFYRRANCALLVFDLTSHESFANCELWIKEIKQNSKEDVVIYLIANKSDLIGSCQVTADEINTFVSQNGILDFSYTSAKTGENIEKIFTDIGRKLITLDKDPNPTDSGKFEIQVVNTKPKKKCCKN